MNYKKLKNKIAIITGSARGIGEESARLLAEAGATTIIADINIEGAKVVAKNLELKNLKGIPFFLDISEESSVKKMMNEVFKIYGGIDILVNNAGILDPTPVPEMTQEKWDRMLEINLRGVQFCSQHVLPYMTKNSGGKIVNISSQAGQLGGFLAGVHYTAAKGGIIALSKAYARYCAQFQINVNCICPGFMLTEMTQGRKDDPNVIPLKRLGSALDVAKAVYFLSTDLSDYITGATIDVNGGYYLR
ncbi:MAG: SDR family oxidoreductase [Treponema sp.]|jgi:acetoacetyl-CoA reductase/3-oxoacyl-[acyl-carrier protein] reductase|nr:SDR family oxidoreductase [Treponema sp.]